MFIELKDSSMLVNTHAVVCITSAQIVFTSGEVKKLKGTDYETFMAGVEKEQQRNAIRRGYLDI